MGPYLTSLQQVCVPVAEQPVEGPEETNQLHTEPWCVELSDT